MIHQCFHIFGEIVDASADVAELMLPLDRGVALENSLGNVLHSDLQFLYRMIDHMIKNRVKNDTGNDGARHDDENDGCKLSVKRIDRDQLRDIAVFRGTEMETNFPLAFEISFTIVSEKEAMEERSPVIS